MVVLPDDFDDVAWLEARRRRRIVIAFIALLAAAALLGITLLPYFVRDRPAPPTTTRLFAVAEAQAPPLQDHHGPSAPRPR